ncbi:MAG TPA: porin family protein [Bacteroidales bacterium]|jgi:hypothetical protein|nr:porin family protein [Bacteroidales bacterium]
MKNIHRHITVTGIAVMVFFLTLICLAANSQEGYPSRMQKPHYRTVPTQIYRQRFDPYNLRDGFQPWVSFSIHFDPLISWFSTDSYHTRSEGAVPGFDFGILQNNYFGPNYSFYSGISIIKAGGRLTNWEPTRFEFKDYYNNSIFTVDPGEAITYRTSYLSIPLGIKLKSNAIGYGRFFTDLGFAPEIVIKSRADIPSLHIYGGNASPELNRFNLSFHIMAGMEYPLAGNNDFIFGIGFDNNLFDITRDNGDQPTNVVTQKMVLFRLGMTF